MVTYITKDYLIDLRSLLGIDQELFAFALGISKSYVSKIETGHMEIVPKLEKKLRPKAKSLVDRIDAEGVRKVAKDLQDAFDRDKAGDEPLVVAPFAPRSESVKAGRHPSPSYLDEVVAEIVKLLSQIPASTIKMFQVEGASMNTTIAEGDRLICRLVHFNDIIDGHVYVLRLSKPELLSYRESGLWVKRCWHRDAKKYVTCKSDNKESTEPYFTFQVSTADIAEVWVPVLRVTGNMADPNRDIYERLDELEERIEMLESEAGME